MTYDKIITYLRTLPSHITLYDEPANELNFDYEFLEVSDTPYRVANSIAIDFSLRGYYDESNALVALTKKDTLLDQETAEELVNYLFEHDQTFHFEDDPSDIVNCGTDCRTFSDMEVSRLNHLLAPDDFRHECFALWFAHKDNQIQTPENVAATPVIETPSPSNHIKQLTEAFEASEERGEEPVLVYWLKSHTVELYRYAEDWEEELRGLSSRESLGGLYCLPTLDALVRELPIATLIIN